MQVCIATISALAAVINKEQQLRDYENTSLETLAARSYNM
jgi:hypothetical protein